MKSKEDIEALAKQQNIVRSDVTLDDGTIVTSYENVGGFDSFRCYICLKPFPTWEESRECKKSHPEGTPSEQMNGGW